MGKKIIGVEIGSFRMKLVDCAGTENERIIVVNVPDNLVQRNKIVSWDAMAEFIKETVKNNKVVARDVAIAIPKDQVFYKRISMPLMTKEQLKINLPFEFHEYIMDDKDKYIYDYAVIDKQENKSENKNEMDIIAVAAEKELVENYKSMFHRAGMRAVIVAPEFVALRKIIKDYETRKGIQGEKDFAVADLGHNSIKLHFFDKGEYEITRVMEMGTKEIDEYIVQKLDVDIHTANIYKEMNKDGLLDTADCIEIYNRIAVEVMRVMNFYDFNHSNNNIDTLFCCGGGAMIPGLINAIRDNNSISVAGINNLLDTEYEDATLALEGILALGITRQ